MYIVVIIIVRQRILFFRISLAPIVIPYVVENPTPKHRQSRRELIKPGLTLRLSPPVSRNRKLGWLTHPRVTSTEERRRTTACSPFIPPCTHLFTPFQTARFQMLPRLRAATPRTSKSRTIYNAFPISRDRPTFLSSDLSVLRVCFFSICFTSVIDIRPQCSHDDLMNSISRIVKQVLPTNPCHRGLFRFVPCNSPRRPSLPPFCSR